MLLLMCKILKYHYVQSNFFLHFNSVFYLLLISVLCRKKIMFVIVSQCLCTYLLFTCPDKFFRGFNNSVHVTKAQIHAWLEQIQKFKDLILFLKTSENELNYTTKQIDNEIAFNEQTKTDLLFQIIKCFYLGYPLFLQMHSFGCLTIKWLSVNGRNIFFLEALCVKITTTNHRKSFTLYIIIQIAKYVV